MRKTNAALILIMLISLNVVSCSSRKIAKTPLNNSNTATFEEGKASWYGKRFHGRQTASGEKFDMHAMTAAHKTLPFGTVVKVLNHENQKEVEVTINDRGPFVKGRVIDLSKAAGKKIGIEVSGHANVSLMLMKGQ